MATPIPDLATVCINFSTGNGEACIELPGGATLCAQWGFDLGDDGDILKNLLGQINSALAPLTPFFNVLDVIKAIADCIQAIPDCLGPPPDPSGIIDCIPNLMEKVNKLLKLLPAMSVPAMVKSILDVIIRSLHALRAELVAMIAQRQRILDAGIKAAALGNIELQALLDCAEGNLDAQFQNKNAAMKPLNRLIGLINTFLDLIGLPCVPGIAAMTALDATALDIIDAAIELLETLKAAIPALDFQLGALPGPDDECPT